MILENGDVSYDQSPVTPGFYPVGTQVSFTCRSGYKLDGSSSSTCMKNGIWNNKPKCTLKGTENKDPNSLCPLRHRYSLTNYNDSAYEV